MIGGSETINFDSEITKAVVDCAEQGSFIPLLKHELRCKIQVKRLSQGQDELNLDEDNQPRKYELSAEELQKKVNRRKQNRNSAAKNRLKEKQKEEELMKKIDKLSSHNAMLAKTKQKLSQQRDDLQKQLKKITTRQHMYCSSSLHQDSLQSLG